MGFLSPYMLWGAAAAGIPVALHFFFRSRYRTVPWEAMKFLLLSIEQTSRRLQFQELLLLVARIMLLAVLGIALARPTASSPGEILLLLALLFWNVLFVAAWLTRSRGSGWLGAATWAGGNAALLLAFFLVYPWDASTQRGQGASVEAVFLFDVSYSMGAADGEKTRFDRAKAAAREILTQLPPHSTVRIFTCADRVLDRLDEPLLPDAARQSLDELRLTDLATDFYPGLTESLDALKRCRSANKEFYLFSDMQKLGWDAQPSGVAQALRGISEHGPVTLVRCGNRALSNVAIVSVTPQVDVQRPGERVAFDVRVRNSGAKPVHDVEVSLTVRGEAKETTQTASVAKIAAGETQTVTLSGKLDKRGLQLVSAAIKHDDVPADNRFDRVVLVRDQVKLLVVDGGPTLVKADRRSSYNLLHALYLLREGEL